MKFRTHDGARGVRLALGAALAAAASATAQRPPSDTLTLRAAVQLAQAANPALRAARASASAAEARVAPAGALPDPQLQFGLMNRMPSALGATTDPMTVDQVQVMQMVPWPGQLSAARDAARHNASAASADADETARSLVARVQSAYFAVAYADRSLVVMQHTLNLLRDFREVSTAMYAVGTSVQQDVLRAQVEVAKMTERISRTTQDRVAAVARLNALLGRDASAAIDAVQLPDSTEALPSADTLTAWALAARPGLRADGERVAAADAAVLAARRALLPTMDVGVSYQARPMYPDMVSIVIGVSLPVFAASKQLAVRREAVAIRDASAASLADRKNDTMAQIVEIRARAGEDQHLDRLYRTSILPQAQAAVDASLAGYRVGQVTFMQLIDNQLTVNDYTIERFRLLADYHQAVGALEALVGRNLEEQP
jgi:outer membrane protein, heavy metal efflux system